MFHSIKSQLLLCDIVNCIYLFEVGHLWKLLYSFPDFFEYITFYSYKQHETRSKCLKTKEIDNKQNKQIEKTPENITWMTLVILNPAEGESEFKES